MITACSQQPKQQEPAKTDTTVGSNTVAESKDKEEQKKDQGDSSIKLTPPNTYPIVEEKVTLKIFTYQNPLVEDMETNQFTRELEELTNVHIEWDLAPQANLAEKRNLVLASGNYPDAFMSAGFSLTDLMTYGTQGVLIPLNDLIEEHAPNVKKHFEDIPTVKEKITAPDGNIYSLGSDQRCYHCGFSRKMWINQSWLDKLNLSMPTTTDEFYQVLKAFREQDPNGNGKADEIPLISAPSEVDIFLMNAFIYNEGGNRFILNDGKVDVAFNKPEWREGLAYLKKLYDEELLDHTSLTTTAEQIKQLANGEVELLGAFPALQPGTYCDLAGERWKHYSVVPPLKGPNGVQLAQYNAYPAAVDAFAITK